jgi:hypothetical protein
MKGTISFERLNCGGELYLRILLNDAVYRKSAVVVLPLLRNILICLSSSCPCVQVRTWRLMSSVSI